MIACFQKIVILLLVYEKWGPYNFHIVINTMYILQAVPVGFKMSMDSAWRWRMRRKHSRKQLQLVNKWEVFWQNPGHKKWQTHWKHSASLVTSSGSGFHWLMTDIIFGLRTTTSPLHTPGGMAASQVRGMETMRDVCRLIIRMFYGLTRNVMRPTDMSVRQIL